MMDGKQHLPLVFMVAGLLSLCTASNSTACMAHESKYLLTFLAPGKTLLTSPGDLTLCLVLTNPSTTTSVELVVERHNQTLTLQPGQINAETCFNGSAAPNGSMKQTRDVGLLITAKHCDTKTLIVHGSVMTTAGLSVAASNAFTVPPVTSLGTEYMVVTHCEIHHCFIGIVAQQLTQVKVRLKLDPQNASLVYNGSTYHYGDVIQEQLGQLEVMQILCNMCDMSGSGVSSSFPVAVLSGGEFTTVGGPGPEFSKMDSMVEYIPPISTLGTRYVIPKDLKASYTIKVVAFYKETVFFVSVLNKCYAASSIGQAWMLPLLEGSRSTVLNSTHPVLVSLIIAREVEDPSAARMTLLQPMSQWNISYQVVQVFPSLPNYLYVVGYVSNFVQGCFQYGISMVNFTDTGRMSSIVEGSSTLKVAQVALSSEISHKELKCSPGCSCRPFWGYVDGIKDKKLRGWAVPLGIFSVPDQQGPRTTDVIDGNCEEFQPNTTSIISYNTTVVTEPLTTTDIDTTTSSVRTVVTEPLTTTDTDTTTSSVRTVVTEPPTTTDIDTMTSPAHTTVTDPLTSTHIDTTSSTQSSFIPETTSPFPPFQTSTPQNTSSSLLKKSMCPCHCHLLNHRVGIHGHGLSVLVETARRRNRKQSASDKRISATLMGCAGVGVLISVSLVIVCSDVASLLGVASKPRWGIYPRQQSGQVYPRH